MILKLGGEIGIEKKRHFALFDMQETFADLNAGFMRMQKLAGGALLSGDVVNISDYGIYKTVPSIWQNDGADSVGAAVFAPDGGLAFSAAAFDGVRTVPNGNGSFAANSYSAVNLSKEPALFVYVNRNNSDVGGSVTEYRFSSGSVLLKCISNYVCTMYALFHYSGTLYLFHDAAGYNAPFGWFAENAASFNLLDYLEPMHLYQIQSVPNVAKGTVYDAAGAPMAGCRVLAYLRETGALIGSAVSGADGKYECPVSAAKGDTVFLVCLDNDAAPDFDARIIDRVTV